ncbi:MAG: hypothetical protein AAFN50_13465 [Pseudomonadota bacterium]
MTRSPQSKNVQEKAAYTGATLRRLNRLRKRKLDAESGLINALAIGRISKHERFDDLVAQIDAAHEAALASLDRIRKTSPLDWQSLRAGLDVEIQDLKKLVTSLEQKMALADSHSIAHKRDIK